MRLMFQFILVGICALEGGSLLPVSRKVSSKSRCSINVFQYNGWMYGWTDENIKILNQGDQLGDKSDVSIRD